MPVFAAVGLFLVVLAIPLAIYFAVKGERIVASLSGYFSVVAFVPFVVSRDSTFFFEKGYLSLIFGGVILVFVAMMIRMLGRGSQ